MMEKEFFEESADRVAPELLGSLIVRKTGQETVKGKIVEIEAYLGKEDPGSHAFNGKTDRNKLMFDTYGKIYVYLCYGLHHMFNVTAGIESTGAVLVRAVEPVEGLEKIKENRNVQDFYSLTDGPGKLTEAFEIDRSFNGENVSEGDLRIEKGETVEEVKKSGRIGISRGKERELRFYIPGNRFVSS